MLQLGKYAVLRLPPVLQLRLELGVSLGRNVMNRFYEVADTGNGMTSEWKPSVNNILKN